MKSIYAIIIISALLISGCNNINKDLIKSSNHCREDGIEVKNYVDTAEQKYRSWISSESFKTFSRFESHYHWKDQFSEARKELASLDELIGNINAIVARNDRNEQDQLKSLIGEFNAHISSAKEKADIPKNQIALLLKYNMTYADLRNINDKIKTFNEHIYPMEKFNFENSIFHLRNDDIVSERYQKLLSSKLEIQRRIDQFNTAYDKETGKSYRDKSKYMHKDGQDYLVLDCLPLFVETIQIVKPLFEEYEKNKLDLVTGPLKELSLSYSKRLIDMKVCYMVTVAAHLKGFRNTFYMPSSYYNYQPVEVSKDTFLLLSNHDGLIAKGTDSPEIFIPVEDWDSLKVRTTAFTMFYDGAEFDVAKLETKYFHRYFTSQIGDENTYDDVENKWQEVSGDFFIEHINDLGMDIEVKPYGYFESEKKSLAMPPGIAFVNNGKYGHWQTENNEDIWIFDGWYSRLNSTFDSNIYSRAQWQQWQRMLTENKVFYGNEKDNPPRYGTFGSKTLDDSFFQDSVFFRQKKFGNLPEQIAILLED